ncbi:MAG: hypothetical protein KA978_27305 [Deltaproteobacteria bacterium]|nr:hypothetical protein [Deltaproteobacteria bacterium]
MRFDAVRSALALVAFGVTGCLAWLHGDAATRPADRGDPAAVVVERSARPEQHVGASLDEPAEVRSAARPERP